MSKIPNQLRIALFVQLVYAALVISWQLIGFGLVRTGGQALGPSASPALAGQTFVIAIFYVFALRRSPAVFVLMSVVTAIAAGVTIENAFTSDPSIWPSDRIRYLGVAANSLGLVAAVLAIVGYVRWRRAGFRA